MSNTVSRLTLKLLVSTVPVSHTVPLLVVLHILSLFLLGRTVTSPNILQTVRRTIIRFLIEFRRTFSSPNMVRTVRRTILRFLTGL